jgi:glycosyltransferase involved in cell wall biosynthesis
VRVCFLADGSSVNTRSWVEHFSKVLGHDVHVLSMSPPAELDPSIDVRDLSVVEGEPGFAGRVANLGKIPRVRKIIAEIEPDLVVGYRVPSYGFVAAMSGFHPLVVVAQSQIIVGLPFRAQKRIPVRMTLRRADLIHSWAPHMSDRLVELGADREKIFECPRGIDLARFAPRDDGADEEYSVITTRSLQRHYRLDVVLQALALARKDVPAITGAVAGTGNCAAELEGLTRDLGIDDRVWFAGGVAYDELPKLLGSSSVYVAAVRVDGVSASLLEAMARGCFPIVWDNAANRHWIEHGRNGFLVADKGPEAYAEAITAALSDRELRARASEINRAIVEERGDLSKNMRTIETAYLKLVESSAARSVRRS